MVAHFGALPLILVIMAISTGGRTTTRHSDYEDPNSRQNNSNMNFGDILRRLTEGGSVTEQLINSFGIASGGEITGTDRKDWNKQLLDTLMQYYMTAENRQYNEGLRDEQRIYDNPISQLARLMGAGISRDQAIQLIGAGSGGSGSSGVPYSQPSPVAEGIAPSQSDLNHAQAVTAKLNTGLGFVQAASGLVSLGFSAAQAIPQIHMLKNQDYLSNIQKQAFTDSSTAFGIISKSGTKIAKDTFGSMASVAKCIQSLSDQGNGSAKQFIEGGGLDRLRDNSAYSLPFLNQLYKNEQEPDYYSRQVESALRLQDAQTNLAATDANKALVEMSEINARISNLDADTDYKEGLKILLSWQAENLNSDTRLKNAESNGIELDNNIKKQFQNSTTPDGISGLQLITDESFARLRRSLMSVNAEIGSKVWESQINTLLSDQRNLQQLYTLQYLYNKGEFDAVSESSPMFQQFLYLSRAAESSGVYDYVRTKASTNNAGSVSWNIGILKGQFNGRDHGANMPLYQLRTNNALNVLFDR